MLVALRHDIWSSSPYKPDCREIILAGNILYVNISTNFHEYLVDFPVRALISWIQLLMMARINCVIIDCSAWSVRQWLITILIVSSHPTYVKQTAKWLRREVCDIRSQKQFYLLDIYIVCAVVICNLCVVMMANVLVAVVVPRYFIVTYFNNLHST